MILFLEIAIGRINSASIASAPEVATLSRSHQAMHEGDYDRACRLTEEALTLFRGTRDKWAIEQHLSDLALFRLLEGHYAQAEALCAKGIALCQELADWVMTAYFMAILAGALAAQGHGVRSCGCGERWSGCSKVWAHD